MALGKTEAALDALTGGTESKIQLDTALAAAYSAGLISYDQVRKVALVDTGYTGVRTSVGLQSYREIFNDSGVTITKGSVVNAGGYDVTNKLIKGVLADASVPFLSAVVFGLAAADIADQAVGLITDEGKIEGIDTAGLTAGNALYLAETAGEVTSVRPQAPNTIVIVGTCTEVHASTGSISVDLTPFNRPLLSRSYSLSTGASGLHYVAGFYDWETTEIALSQASLTQTYGTAGQTRAGHAGVVPEAAGTTDAGQVGLRVTGTLDSETGIQVAAQTQDITDDITTLSADTLAETVGHFSGEVTFELYVVSGSPTTYALTFNYGFSNYEDYEGKDFSITGFEAVWEGGATEPSMNLELVHHQAAGWTHAASSFEAGDGTICDRLVDQAEDSAVANGVHGSYKRSSLDQFVEGSEAEGVLVRLTTTTNNAIAAMNVHIVAVGEELG